MKIYDYNRHYFDKIDTKDKAYWLGFITADGYLMDNRKKDNKSTCTGLRIRLSIVDKNHLEKLNESMECNKPIKIVKNYGIYENNKDLAEFVLYSKDIVNSLNKNGISCGNKSCHENIPTFLNNDLMKYFILGLFDGDGSISIGKTVEWSIVSSKEMVEFIKNFLEKELNIKFNKISKNGNGKDLYRIRTCNRNNIKILYNYFYTNNNLYLERKYQKMKMFNI